jgi:hypothetical protein
MKTSMQIQAFASTRCHDHVILFAFAQQDVLAEEQIVRRHRPRGAGFTEVVDVDATSFDIFPRLPFARAKTGSDQ